MDVDDLILLIERVVTAKLAAMYGMRPGLVQSYDAVSQTVVVIPEPQERDVDGNPISAPALADVPVIWSRGGGASLTWPLKAGDRVMLLGASADLDDWRASGGQADPGEDRRWHPSDVVAVPGMWPRNGALAPAQASDVDAVLEPPAGGQLLLGGSAVKAAARVDDAVGSGSLSFSAAAIPPGPPPGVIFTLTWTPQGGGAPTIQTVTVTGAITGVAAGAPAALAGKITAGSAKTRIQ